MKDIIIGCDNLAVEMKQTIIGLLARLGVPYEDVGVFSEDDAEMYPLVAQRVAAEIINSNYSKEGILLCGTGIGMAIAANKFPGIYAAVCHDSYSAEWALVGDKNRLSDLLVPDNERQWGTWMSGYGVKGQPRGLRFTPINEIVDERYTTYFPIHPQEGKSKRSVKRVSRRTGKRK